MGELLHPEVRIETARRTHRGLEAALEWSGKGFDHIHRRYLPVQIETVARGALVHAELKYVWNESGKVGDSSAVTIELGIRDGLISSWELTEVEGLEEI